MSEEKSESCPRHRISYPHGSYCPGCVAGMALLESDHDREIPIATLGGYELVSELGRGGMGVVYLARQTGLNRRVALKLLPSGSLAGEEFIRRFRREGELAASLQHPNIVRIFEAGEAEGELFCSMELILGGSLADWRDGKSQRPRDAAKVMRTLAFAVAYAHRHGVLHRDLKPSNILIDEDGHPKIADFGLARPLESGSDITLASHSFGSPAYMAPELIRSPGAAAAASDIYSLGAILYFLLTGRPPFVSASLDELLRQVRECEPAPPRLLDPSIPKDLQKICLKALDKNPARRYAAARELAEDLERFLAGRPVLARPAGPLMKVYRLARRAPWLSGTLLLLAIALAGGAAGVIRQSNIANQRADETARKAAELRLNLYASDIAAASTALRRGDTPLAGELLSRWDHPARGEDPRGFEWRLLRQQAQPTPNRLLDRRSSTITSLAYAADGKRIAVADQGGKLLIQPGAVPVPFPAGEVAAIPATLGGGWVIGSPAGEIRWLDPDLKPIHRATGRQFSLAEEVPRAAIGELSRFHWTGKAGAVSVIDWRTGEVLREFPGQWRHAVISPDGRTVALAGLAGGLELIQVGDGETRKLPTLTPVWALSFSHDGRMLAAGTRRVAIIWDLGRETKAPLVIPHELTIWTTAFSPDGSRFLTSSSDRLVRVWRMDNLSAPPVNLSGHRGEVWCAAFSPDGNSVAAGGKDGDALGWQLAPGGDPRPPLAHQHPNPPFFSPDGRRLVTYCEGLSIVHGPGRDQETPLPEGVLALGFSAGGEALLVADGKGRTGRAGVADPRKVVFFPAAAPPAPPWRMHVLSGGRWIARVARDGGVQLVDPADGTVSHRVQGPPPGMRHVLAGSPDGRLVAIGGDGERALVMHDLATGAANRLDPPSSTYYYVHAEFSPDGTLLAAGDLSGPIRIWNTASRELVITLPGHPEETSALAFSPDGRTLASMGFHQDLKIWHTATWREVHSVNLPEAAYDLVFSPDGKRLLATMGLAKNERIQWFPPADPEK